MSPLPIVGDSVNTWGTTLNNFLSTSLNGDGTLKNGVSRLAGTSATAQTDIWLRVQDYGPVAQNGDITAALQAVFTALRAAGADTQAYAGIELPTGSYTISTSINGTGLGGLGGLEIKASGPGACHLTINLSAALPGFDFTGSARVQFRNVYLTGNAAGSQTCAVLGARALSDTAGDHAVYSGLLIDGTFAQCVVGLISCDQTSIYDSELTATAPNGLFSGTTDVLGIGSAYQTFASVTANTILNLNNVSVYANSRSGILFHGGQQLNLRGVYCALFGSAAHGIELLGNGGHNIDGDIRIETPTTNAVSQDVVYVNSTQGITFGNLRGNWNFHAATDCAVVRFNTNELVTSVIIQGSLVNAGAGTIKLAAGSTGTIQNCVSLLPTAYPIDAGVTVLYPLFLSGGLLRTPSAFIPAGGILQVERLSTSDAGLVAGGDGQGGDAYVIVYRGGSTTEFLKILGANGGTSGLNNVFTVDRVAASAAAERPIQVRSSVNSGSSFTTQMQVLPKGSVSVGLSAVATNATDGFPYIPANAGTPTGTPTAQSGFVPMYYDTTNHKIWVYDGAWKGVVVS